MKDERRGFGDLGLGIGVKRGWQRFHLGLSILKRFALSDALRRATIDRFRPTFHPSSLILHPLTAAPPRLLRNRSQQYHIKLRFGVDGGDAEVAGGGGDGPAAGWGGEEEGGAGGEEESV